LSRQEQKNAQRAPAREQQTQQARPTAQERQQQTQLRQRDTLSRQTAERQTRIDRLQQHVQQLQAQQGRGRGAQRELQTQQRLLNREQSAQQRDLAQQQKLGASPVAPQRTAAATQAAARGRFAARFHNNADPRAQVALAARLNGWAPRNAWRHKVRAAFIPWLGPVFWPYAYADIFDYTFWPSAYDDAYWAYAYDDFVDTLFWDVGSPYSAYASIAPDSYLEPGSAMVGSSRLRERSGLSPQALRQLCSNPDRGVTAWPFADIARVVRPTAEQRDLLDQLKRAAAQAAETLKSSCSDNYALTPPGRLQAMINRVSATLEAVRIVRPPVEAFYNSLSDEQQARFNLLGPQLPSSPDDQSQQAANANREGCGAPKASLTQLPIERINAVLRPTGAQKDALDHLSAATEKSVRVLQKACPYEVPLTPVGRLQAMEKRLSAMLEAANLVQPPLNDFYASLNSEQKARFNTLQQVAGQ
jgi:TolA-binding protein